MSTDVDLGGGHERGMVLFGLKGVLLLDTSGISLHLEEAVLIYVNFQGKRL